MRLEDQILSHQDVCNGVTIGKDSEGIGSFALSEGVVGTFLNNPYIKDRNSPLVLLGRIDDDVCGRIIYFPTRLRINGIIEESLGASSLLVNERGRDYSIGARLMMYPIQSKKCKYLLYAGISKMAEPLYKKLLKFEWFDIPCKWQPRNTRFLYQSIGLRGVLLNLATCLSNIILRPMIGLSTFLSCKTVGQYEVKMLKEVPQWVEDIVAEDTHKYMEYHSRQWFEWVLKYNFCANKNDIQKLFGVYKDGIPVGFFLLKERQVSIPEKGIDNVVFGTMIEWGVKKETQLNEYAINKLAFSHYSNRVDIVQAISDNHVILKKISKYLFIRHGNANFAFRDLTKSLDKDYKQMQNWRIRVGYSDVAFY